jgi:predicted regulator of Ras-like GTPase activity (Roadblock/LC7/MglB family)
MSGTKNITFSLPVEIIEKFREYAKCNYIPSINSGVKEALEAYMKKIEKDKLEKEMLEASKDNMFMQDLEDSMCAFESADKEMEMKQEW